MAPCRRLAGAAAAVLARVCTQAQEQGSRNLNKRQEASVAVSTCYRQCFDTMAAVDREPILRADIGAYSTTHSSRSGNKRCLAAIRSQFVIEQCGHGC